jgi:hypothetical protein
MALTQGRKALLALALLALAAARPARAQGNDDTDLDDATVVDLAGLTDSAPPLPARPPAAAAWPPPAAPARLTRPAPARAAQPALPPSRRTAWVSVALFFAQSSPACGHICGEVRAAECARLTPRRPAARTQPSSKTPISSPTPRSAASRFAPPAPAPSPLPARGRTSHLRPRPAPAPQAEGASSCPEPCRAIFENVDEACAAALAAAFKAQRGVYDKYCGGAGPVASAAVVTTAAPAVESAATAAAGAVTDAASTVAATATDAASTVADAASTAAENVKEEVAAVASAGAAARAVAAVAAVALLL